MPVLLKRHTDGLVQCEIWACLVEAEELPGSVDLFS